MFVRIPTRQRPVRPLSDSAGRGESYTERCGAPEANKAGTNEPAAMHTFFIGPALSDFKQNVARYRGGRAVRLIPDFFGSDFVALLPLTPLIGGVSVIFSAAAVALSFKEKR